MSKPVKPRFLATVARAVALVLVRELQPACERLEIAGSLRRQSLTVGDIELLYVPAIRPRPGKDFFAAEQVNLAEEAIERLLSGGILAKRLNKLGRPAWGPENKLARHVASGIPVDLFSTTQACWHNYLVCRTGPAESNTRIAAEALKRGWKWHPYGQGFTDDHGQTWPVFNERDVFETVGLPYHEPHDR